jgi:pantoate--beta-alanine ligase
LYPPGFSSYVEVEGLSNKLEGQSRPGHFRSVTTALSILLNIVHPHFLFVGQRDPQQAVIIKKLVRELHLPVEVVVTAIARESDGLACASRNKLLSPEQRKAAPVLYRAVHLAEEMFADGERRAGKILKAVRRKIEEEPLAKIDYLAVTDTENLDPLDDLENRKALVSVAAYFGNTRLIDNVVLKEDRFKGKTGKLIGM